MRIKAVAALVVAAIIATGLAVCYGSAPRFYEMSFLSNAFACIVLTAAAILLFCGREAPHFLYLNCTTMLLLVVGVCAMFAPDVCFAGASVMLHLVSPVLVTLFYISFCRPAGMAVTAVTAITLPWCYYAFMIVYGRVSGSSVYAYFDTNAMTAPGLIAAGVLGTVIVLGAAFTLMLLSRLAHMPVHVAACRTAQRRHIN